MKKVLDISICVHDLNPRRIEAELIENGKSYAIWLRFSPEIKFHVEPEHAKETVARLRHAADKIVLFQRKTEELNSA